MKKTALFCAALLAVSASAFAYTNEYAGYSINNKKPEALLESQQQYGYKDPGSNSIHLINFFTAEDMSKVVEEKFTTAYFDACYHKLAVLDKNQLDKTMLKLPLLDLERYAKLNPDSNALMDSELFKKKNTDLKPEIRLDKIAGKKAITLSLTFKEGARIVATDLSFVSVNDMVYLLSTGTMEELTVAPTKEGETAKKSAVAEEKKKQKLEPMARKDLDVVLANSIWQSHTKFAKLFKTTAPVKNAKQEIVYTDNIAGQSVTLPKAWGYVQYNYNDKKNPAVISFALPANTFSRFGQGLVAKDNGLLEAIGDDKKTNEVFGNALLKAVDQLFLSCSVKTDKDKLVADMLANPLAAKLEADIFLETTLKRAERLGHKFVKLNKYSYKTKFDDNMGKLDLMLDVTLLDKHDFINFLKLAGTSEKGSCLLQLTKKGIEVNPALKKIYDEWSF